MFALLEIWRRRFKAGTAIPPPLPAPTHLLATGYVRLIDTSPRVKLIDTSARLKNISSTPPTS